MRTPTPRTMILRSDTRKLVEITKTTKKEDTSDGEHLNEPKMALNKRKGRMGLKRRRARKDTKVTKDRGGYFQFDLDVIWEILLRVSCIEALLACHCVCKTWYNLTKNPSFVDAHVKISSKQPPRFICRDIFFPDGYLDHDRLLLCDMDRNKTRNMPLEEYVFRERKIIFSHNGLLCLSPHDCGARAPVVICNPITKECIELPRTDDVEYAMPPLVGFCFVPTLQKHVVVQLSTTPNGEERGFVTRCYILTSGESSWRLLTRCPSLNYCFFEGNTVYWNNAFHWTFIEGVPPREFILSFDTVHETFQIIPCPEDTCHPQQRFSLLVLNGRLNLIKRLKTKTKLWEMMGDRGGVFSLVGRETYEIDSPWSFTLRSRLNDDELLMTAMHGSASCTDIVVASNEMKQFKTVPINGLPSLFTMVDYNPSLASVRSMDLPK